MGIRQLIIAVNIYFHHEEDNLVPCFGALEYDRVRTQMTEMMKKIGYTNVTFVPICAKLDINISEANLQEKWKWTSSDNITLYEAIASLRTPKRVNMANRPFRMVVADVCKIGGVGTVLCGKVLAGKIQTA